MSLTSMPLISIPIASLSIKFLLSSTIYTVLTLSVYFLFAQIQGKIKHKQIFLWFNPMLLTIIALIIIFSGLDIDYQEYKQSTKSLTWLIEPAVVALGLPLYQQLSAIKSHWKQIFLLLLLANTIVIVISFVLVMLLVGLAKIAISLSLKSVTTAIGITLTQQLNGDLAITAFAIILAGLFGALFGRPWLNFIQVSSAKAQGLAIGAASHVLGTATISQTSYQHSAFASLALIVSAVITALVAPVLITYCLDLF